MKCHNMSIINQHKNICVGMNQNGVDVSGWKLSW